MKAQTMPMSVQVTFRGMDGSDAVGAAVRRKTAQLEKFHPNILRCRVVIEEVARHRTTGRQCTVHVGLKAPGGEIAVTHDHDEDVHVAIRDAFAAVRRKLDDFARLRRREVKHHAPPKD